MATESREATLFRRLAAAQRRLAQYESFREEEERLIRGELEPGHPAAVVGQWEVPPPTAATAAASTGKAPSRAAETAERKFCKILVGKPQDGCRCWSPNFGQ